MRSMSLVLVILALLTGASAVAGTESSGGGGAVLCRNLTSKASLRSFDLYEAQHGLGLHLLPKLETVADELAAFQTRFSALVHNTPYADGAVQTAFDSFLRKLRPIARGTRLPIIDDTQSTVALPPECEYVQVIRYVDGGDQVADYADIDTEYWSLLAPQDRVALFAHEIHYKMVRKEFGATDSRIARRWVGHMFSKEGLEPADAGLPSLEEMVDCWGSPNTFFRTFLHCSQGRGCVTQVQFENLNGVGLLEKTVAVSDESLFADLKAGRLGIQRDLILSSKTWGGLNMAFKPLSNQNGYFFQIQIQDRSLSVAPANMLCGPAR